MYLFKLNFTWIGLIIVPWILMNGIVAAKDIKTGPPLVVPVTRLLEARQVPIRPAYATRFPPWANLTMIGIRQKFMRDYFVGFIGGLGLGAGILVNKDVVRVLLDPGNVTDPLIGMQRYLSNGLYVKYWSVIDMVRDQDNLFETLNLIHAIHAKVGMNSNNNNKVTTKLIFNSQHPRS